MQSAEQPPRGAARAVRPDHLSKLMWLVAAVMAGAGLTGCAEPSPQVQVATADASQSATAGSDSTGQPAANDSAAAATAEPGPDATDATTSGDATPPVTTADNSTPPAAASTPPAEPQAASDPASAAPATEVPQTAAAPQPAPAQTAAGAGAGDVHPPGSGLATGRPYVVIRFTESSIDYEKTLAEAVKRAVARKPNLAFDLVAVTPRAGTADELADLTNQAHAEAEAVMKSLSALGIGPERVSMMTWTGQPTDVNEIRLYIR